MHFSLNAEVVGQDGSYVGGVMLIGSEEGGVVLILVSIVIHLSLHVDSSITGARRSGRSDRILIFYISRRSDLDGGDGPDTHMHWMPHFMDNQCIE